MWPLVRKINQLEREIASLASQFYLETLVWFKCDSRSLIIEAIKCFTYDVILLNGVIATILRQLSLHLSNLFLTDRNKHCNSADQLYFAAKLKVAG